MNCLMPKHSKINLEGYGKPYVSPRPQYVCRSVMRENEETGRQEQAELRHRDNAVGARALAPLVSVVQPAGLLSHRSSFIRLVWLFNFFMRDWSFYPITFSFFFNLS